MLAINTLFAQETIKHDETNTWFTLLNGLHLNKNWSLANEFHERTGAFLDQQATFILRPSVEYHVNDNIILSVGYSHLNNSPNNPNPNPKIAVTENNVWEQVLIKNKINKTIIQHRFRQENRWFDTVDLNLDNAYVKTGTDFGNRFRYRITVTTPIKALTNGKEIFFNGFDEAWVTQTDNLVPKAFSRNWLYIWFGL
jgi:hypothetical protein